MKKIYFKGYYGFQNLGDDIFCVTADWICKNYWANYEPIFLGNKLPKISNSKQKIEIENAVARKVLEFIISIKAKYIIYFGGSVLSTISGVTDIKYHYNLWKIFNKKIGTIGTSIGPFKNDNNKKDIEEFISKFLFVSVRDFSSLHLAEQMKLKVKPGFSFDPAILISEVYPILKKDKSKSPNEGLKIAVSLCHYERYKGNNIEEEKKREDSINDFLNSLIEQYNDRISEIIFFVFNGNSKNGDTEIIETFNNSIKNKINTSIIDYSSDTLSICKEINKCNFLIGTRLHSGILAYALEIPFMLVEYHPKCTQFLNTINHNYRFKIENTKQNLESFEKIILNDKVPDIKEVKYFKKIMLEEINRIGKIIENEG